jgi:hypothetical protein
MSSNATTNETSNFTSLASTPKAQTAKEVIAANVIGVPGFLHDGI